MPNGLTIAPSTTMALAATASAVASGAGHPAAAPATPPRVASGAPGSPNPSLRLDPALGIVVLQFSAGTGSGTTTIPSQQQLNAYRDGSATPPGNAHPDKRTV